MKICIREQKGEINSLPPSSVNIAPLTPELWEDFLTLFGKSGACGGCFCMWWRLSARDFEANKGDQNRRLMKELVFSSKQPGILLFLDDKPIGWCSLAPRNEFPRLNRSRILKRVDDKYVLSIVCFYIDRKYRRQGFSELLLKGAIDFARSRGAKILEAYPIDAKKEYPAVFAFTGFVKPFARAGFKEVARRSEKRPIMRLSLEKRIK